MRFTCGYLVELHGEASPWDRGCVGGTLSGCGARRGRMRRLWNRANDKVL